MRRKKTKREWATVLVGRTPESGTATVVARFRADGDAFLYAKDLRARPHLNERVWVRPKDCRWRIV